MPITHLHNDSQLIKAAAPFFTHEYINYYCIQGYPKLLEQKPIPILPPQENPVPVGKYHKDEYIEEQPPVRELDPFSSFDCAIRNGEYTTTPPLSVKIEPWKILIYYCTVPDMQLDCDLELSPLQKLTGGSHGYRHMYFDFFGIKLGQTPSMLKAYLEAALNEKEKKRDYWGWRYLAYATHYLADLGHPFHVKVIPYRELLKVSMKNLPPLLMAVHNIHEVYTQFEFRKGNEEFSLALIKGVKDGLKIYYNKIKTLKSFLKEVKRYRKNATRLMKPIYRVITKDLSYDVIEVYITNYKNRKDKTKDLSKETLEVEKKVQELLLQEKNKEACKRLGKLTEETLYHVGKIFGALFTFLTLQGFIEG